MNYGVNKPFIKWSTENVDWQTNVQKCGQHVQFIEWLERL